MMLSVTTAVQDGAWDSVATWSNGVPDDSLRAVIPTSVTVTLTGDDHVAKELVVQGVLDVAEVPGEDKTLTANWIHVNSGGVFQIGTEQDRYDEANFVVTIDGQGTGTSFNIEGLPGPINNNNAFLMAAGGGRLQFFGGERLTFTRLAATAQVGANQIQVESVIDRDHDGDLDADDGTLNWRVGDEIVISSSTRDYSDEEVRTITAIEDQGDGTQLLTLNAPLAKRHYGEIETYGEPAELPGDFDADGSVNAADYALWRDQAGRAGEVPLNGAGDRSGRVDGGDQQLWAGNFGAVGQPGVNPKTWEIDLRAEVAVLNRTVRFQGLASQDTDNSFGDRARFNAGLSTGFGAHTMIMPTAGQITIDSVQFDRMGQTASLGRYPIHWHIAGDRTGDVLRGSSITNSNNRGVTVHGTHNLLIEDNVLHDIHGHGFFIEDAVETGNLFRSNIAFGIHAVGRSEAVGDNDPDLSDPFIVDTHDHVGQNATRFLSSAAFWITNPDNDFFGNVVAGSEGTGYWYILPERAIGAAANDPQYAGVRPDRVNLGLFDHNSSHSSPIGLNFDRGSDIEGPVGSALKARFDGDDYRPTVEPRVTNYTAYKHTTGIYHRSRVGSFEGSRFADNFTSTFLTFTQRLEDTLYVGHSRGNSNPSDIVTGHTFYDGANTHDGTHFAGFAAANASMFRTQGIAIRHTHFVMRDSSFEDDGSANNLQFADQGGGFSSYDVLGQFMPSVIYDEDGSLTGHVGGGPGSTIVPGHPFFHDSGDFAPAGWRNAVVSDDLYANFRFRSPSGQNPTFRVTTPDGDVGQDNTGAGQFAGTNTLLKMNAGDYTVSLPFGNGSASNGFDILYFAVNGPRTGSTVVRFAGMGSSFSVGNRPLVSDLEAVRNASQTVWTRVGNDLYVNFFSVASETDRVNFVPGGTAIPSDTLWRDDNPLSSGSVVNSGLTVTTVSGSVAGDPSRAAVGRVAITGDTKFGVITPGQFTLPSEYRGTGYELRVDYFIPPGTSLDGPDVLFVQTRFNGVNADFAGFVGDEVAGQGWQSIVLTGTVPFNANNTQPFVTLSDGGPSADPNGNGQGTAFFVDNIRFTVGLPTASTAAALVESFALPTPASVEQTSGTDGATPSSTPQVAAAISQDRRLDLLALQAIDRAMIAIDEEDLVPESLALEDPSDSDSSTATSLAMADYDDEFLWV